ncbi:pleckstrin homology domain-containing family B member 2-like [Asterias amurensis]|uniref:pleckstrin homology domain-containing family B member 2-like n=1 Tax=Asterias amurensis TaxID=7602 RepID=UPI003AB252FF
MASLEVARSHGIAKASWMQRQSDVLSRWKYSFCVLYRNGKFNFYKDEKMTSEQGSINIPKSCYAVNAGLEISGSPTPPTGRDKHCLLELRSHEINVLFCTDSVDDSVTWKSSILEVKNSLTQPAQPPAAAQPSYMMAPPPYTVTQAPVQQVMLPQVQQVVAPPVQHVQVNPYGGCTTTYTTYQAPNTQYVVPPTNQTVIVNGRTCHQRRTTYPVQNTVYTYPGQQVYTYQAGQNLVTRY